MCSTPPTRTTSAAPIAISPAPGGDRGQRTGAHAVDGEAGHGLRQAGEQRDVASEGQTLVADLGGRGHDDVVDALGRQRRITAQQLADDLHRHVVGARLPEDALLARAAERRAHAVDEEDFLQLPSHSGGSLVARDQPDRAGDAGAAETAVAARVLREVLLVVVLGVVERRRVGDLRRDLAVPVGRELALEHLA